MTTPPTILSEQEIVSTWQGMPGGPDGWLTNFGFLQFARAIEAAAVAKLAEQAGQFPEGLSRVSVELLDEFRIYAASVHTIYARTAAERDALQRQLDKLTEGVELEATFWHDDETGEVIAASMHGGGASFEALIPLSTAQAAVAAERAKAHRCKGIPREGCDYLASCESICNKCGREHTLSIQSSPAPAAEPARPAGWDNQWDQFRPPLGDVVKRLRARRGLGNLGLEFVNDINQLLTACESALAWQPSTAEPVPRFVSDVQNRLIYDNDNTHDGVLRLDGDFATAEERGAYFADIIARLNATPSPLPAAAGVEERAGLAEQAHKLADVLETQVRRYGEGNGAEEDVERSRNDLRAAIDRLASSAAQVPEDARDAARYRWLRDASRFRDGGLIVGEAEGEDVAWGDHLDLLVDREMAEGPADPAAEPAADWDDNPEGVVAGEESGPRMDPHTGVWDEPEAPGELCRACDGTGRVPSPKECLRCGMRGCQSDECTACGGTGEVAAAPAAGGEQS